MEYKYKVVYAKTKPGREITDTSLFQLAAATEAEFAECRDEIKRAYRQSSGVKTHSGLRSFTLDLGNTVIPTYARRRLRRALRLFHVEQFRLKPE